MLPTAAAEAAKAARAAAEACKHGRRGGYLGNALCAWGWVRLAVAGVAGAHERPLALLLLHLGAAQARS